MTRRGIDLDAGTHGGGNRHPLDIRALRALGLGLGHRVDESRDILRRASPRANEALPTLPWTIPAFSTRNSTEPPFEALTAPVTSIVTVPTFGLGIRPRGPRTLPSRPTSGIMSGVAIQRSKRDGAALDGCHQFFRPDDIGARRLGLVGLGAAREDRDAQGCARSHSGD